MKYFVKPGQTPLDDLSGLKLKIPNITVQQLYDAEAENIQKAILRYMAGRLTDKKAPFDLTWVMKLHREMLGNVWDWAGEFRNTNTSIGVDKVQIQMQLLQLLDDLKAWPSMDMPFLEQAVRLHHRAVQIHPFKNGNGRWSRMLSNIWLKKNKSALIRWPETIDDVSPVRDEYLVALKKADGLDIEPLLDLHKRYLL